MDASTQAPRIAPTKEIAGPQQTSRRTTPTVVQSTLANVIRTTRNELSLPARRQNPRNTLDCHIPDRQTGLFAEQPMTEIRVTALQVARARMPLGRTRVPTPASLHLYLVTTIRPTAATLATHLPLILQRSTHRIRTLATLMQETLTTPEHHPLA